MITSSATCHRTRRARTGRRDLGTFLAAVALSLGAPLDATAQSGAAALDSTLNHLVHPPGTAVGKMGELGAVAVVGEGPVDVLVIPGWGFGAREFETFAHRHRSEYRFVIATLPGFAGTAPLPMPPAGTSYAEVTWMQASEAALLRVFETHHLREPIILAHFIIGTQLGVRLAAQHPAKVRGLVVMGGEAMRWLASPAVPGGQTLASPAERAKLVDERLAAQWFKFVTKATFEFNNYRPPQYSLDPEVGAQRWQAVAETPLPTLIRYLCEYSAADYADDYARLKVPTVVLRPEFSAAVLADTLQRYVKPLFIASWDRVRDLNPRIDIVDVPRSGIFVSDDAPQTVEATLRRLAQTRP